MRRGLGRAAVLIGSITVLARVAGFGRTLVFAHTVGNTRLGTAYTTANQVPNIIFDIVAGGALTAVVVPVLAGPADRADDDPAAAADARRTASALLTWTMLVLVPLSVILALAAEPVVTVLLGHSHGPGPTEVTAVATRMLVVFAPQITLYGLAVVIYGILQSHHRFAAPALAPLISSLVVSVAYLAFLPAGHGYQNNLRGLPQSAQLILSAGTTAGVAALVATVAVPAWRLRLRLRPALRFPHGIAPRVRGLAAAGIATLVAQDAALVAVIVLANSRGGTGALVLYNYGWQMFFLPYAVLAVPVATTAFPLLSAHASAAGAAARLAESAGAAEAALTGEPGVAVVANVARVTGTAGVARSAEAGVATPAGNSGPPPAGAAGPAPEPPCATAERGTKSSGAPDDGAAITTAEHGKAGGGGAARGFAGGDEIAALGPVADGGTGRGSAGGVNNGAYGARARFDSVAAASTRAAVLVSCLGAAALAGVAAPAARVFVQPASTPELTFAFVAFAPGLIGYGLVTNLSRVLLAAGRSRSVAVTTVAGWLTVMAADLAIVPFAPRRWVVPALGLGNTVGLTIAGLALLVAVAMARGGACLAGLARSSAAGLAAATAGAAAGALLGTAAIREFGVTRAAPAALLTAAAGAVTVAVFLVVAYLADPGDMRTVTRRVFRRAA